uniref:Retrovirus-related Pol polyprotein from transposon TNT 1-94 n=1 Tax=Tanacetum cinerariifolium TaxID=118510 RepID=A0A6L2JTZ9_TANCI|nr:retrovirus-related Pol polyprotein from transposon TNT 1-94 [Tanacetum cinerariifolium]
MKDVFNQIETKVDNCSVERKYFKIKKKELFIENDHLLEHIICQDVMRIAMHDDLENKCVLHANDDNLEYAEMEQSYINEYSRLSHLNFGTINELDKQGLIRGLLKLKYEKDHLCSVCSLGKSKKQTHKPKYENSIQEKLYLLHMDLCGPMRIKSIMGRITYWLLLMIIEGSLGNICTDNGIEFVNQTLKTYYEDVGISHQTIVACTSQQNNVVERQNWTLVEAAHTISEESSSRDVIVSDLHPTNQPFKHLSKWIKNHPLDNVIGNPSRPVSTRHQLQTNAMWCYFDAFLTSAKPKNYKEVLKEFCWIKAMHEEIQEFERLQVWELVSRLNYIMLINLKWIFKVKLNEFGGVLKNKARLVAKSFHHEEGVDFEESFTPVARI